MINPLLNRLFYSTIKPICRLCKHKLETTHHLLTECEPLNGLQRDILGEKLIMPDLKWPIKHIL